jgi:hypothetical protein
MTAQSTYSQLRTQGIEGQLADSGPNEVTAMRNDEASAEMAFGIAVKFASTTDERSAKLLTAITGEIVAGILHHSHQYADTALGTTGVKAAEQLNILRRGRILVACEDGCNVGDRLFIRAVATGGEKAGALRASADASDTIDSQGQGVWRTSAAAGGLAVLEVDFINPLT